MYNKLLIAIDLSDLKSAKYVVDTCLKMTGQDPNTVYRVVTIIEPVDDSFISAFLPKNFDKSVVEEANKEESDVKIDLDKIDGNTYLKDLIKVYPKLKDDMIKISDNFKLLQTPLAAVMLPTVTLKKASERGEVELNTLIEKIKEIIKTY